MYSKLTHLNFVIKEANISAFSRWRILLDNSSVERMKRRYMGRRRTLSDLSSSCQIKGAASRGILPFLNKTKQRNIYLFTK